MITDSLKTVRLSKAASEFNVSVQTIIEFLAKKSIKIETNPNTKLPSNVYDLLLAEFKSDKKVKEEAEKIGLDYSSHQTISIEDKKASRKAEEDEQEDLIIKGLSMNYKQKVSPKESKPAPVAPKEEQAPAKKKEPEAEVVAAVETPVVIAPEPEVPVAETIAEVVAEEIPAIPAPPPAVVSEEPPRLTAPVILGKIDLEEVDSRSGKKKKKPAAKAPVVEEAPAAIPEEVKPEVEKTEVAHIQAPAEPEAEVVPEAPAAGIAEETKAPEAPIEEKPEEVIPKEQGPNFMKTQFTKLTGPVILGKMELPAAPKPHEKKPVASSSDDKMKARKKRKRIKSETEAAGAAAAVARDKDKPKPQFKDKKGGVRKEVFKPEVSQEEIQKQIKETLQRLAGGGKSKSSKLRKGKREKASRALVEAERLEEEGKRVIKVTEFVTANELATMMNVSVTDIISTCMSVGLFVSINQRLDAETLLLVAEEFGFKVEFVSYEVQDAITGIEAEDEEGDLVERAPIVTVMGHVDHGKTLLLDHIRKTNVVAGEAGGITQHIGASEVWLESGKKITFLDTPGHEAFTAMRARGAKVTDVAIVIIAADDAVMPQTVEAINHAQAAGVPIVFALNKIDKPGANPEKIREQLANMNILVEDWGGKYQCQEISAKAGKNIELLLDKVLLESEVLELKANPGRHAIGTVIESSLDRGRGFVAKVLVQNGTLSVGDIVLAGSTYGRVKAMYNERNTTVKEAGPSTPVLLLGLNGAPQPGDSFNVLKDEKEAKTIATKRQQLQREQGLRTQKHITLDEIGRRIAIGDFKELNLIVKGDFDGSVEALTDELLKLTTPEVQVNVIHKDVGQVTESDVLLASASNAIIVGFQVRPSMKARKLAEQEQIDIRLYSVIYTAVSEIKDAIEGMLSPKIEEKIVCNIEVREVFRITKVGSVAGCMVLDGKVTRNTRIRVIRNGIVAYTGYLGSLKRFKDDVKEVLAGYECGLNIENYNDIKEGDIIEGYEEIEVKRKL